jgi:hypothetical protein
MKSVSIRVAADISGRFLRKKRKQNTTVTKIIHQINSLFISSSENFPVYVRQPIEQQSLKLNTINSQEHHVKF